MPDLISVLARRWKMMILLTMIATGTAFLACLLRPKEYAGVTTALPANSLVGDKARIFHQTIDALYPEVGTPDELDKIEGTAKLDTIYLAAAKNFQLTAHYALDASDPDALPIAARKLKKRTEVKRTGFGELQVKVWDQQSQMAADLANALLQELNTIHQHLQTENNRVVLQQLKEDYTTKTQLLNGNVKKDSTASAGMMPTASTAEMLRGQVQQYSQLINEYELALKTTPKVLLVVEEAKPKLNEVRPDLPRTLLFTFLGSLLFAFLLALFVDSRKQPA